MTEKHWAISVLTDIQNALDRDKHDVASHLISDAIDAILDSEDPGRSDARKILTTHCTCFARRM